MNLQVKGGHDDQDLIKYVDKKIGQLDKYVPRQARQAARAEVKFKDVRLNGKDQRLCEVVVHLPHDIISVQEATVNAYASVDIVEAKLRNQLKRYKDKHSVAKLRHRLRARLARRA